jgi:hypothetical protein
MLNVFLWQIIKTVLLVVVDNEHFQALVAGYFVGNVPSLFYV